MTCLRNIYRDHATFVFTECYHDNETDEEAN